MTGAALVNNELGVEALLLEERGKGLDVVDFIVVRVTLGDRIGRGRDERVVVGDVCDGMSISKFWQSRQKLLTGSETTDFLRRTGSLVNLGEELSSRLKVGSPTEPSGVSCVHVGDDTDGRKLRECVVDTCHVRGLGVRAVGVAQVGDQVSQRVGLNDGHNSNGWVLCEKELVRGRNQKVLENGKHTLDDRDNLVDVVLIVRNAVVSDGELSVGRLRMAVTVGQVVDDNRHDRAAALCCSIGHVRVKTRNFRNRVEPDEGRNVGNGRCFRLKGGVCDLGSGCCDLGRIVRAQICLCKSTSIVCLYYGLSRNLQSILRRGYLLQALRSQ